MKLIHTQRRPFTRLIPLCLLTLALLPGCASDNVHQPDPDATPMSLQFSGDITSRIPAFPSFEPVSTEGKAALQWDDPIQTRATITLDAFSIFVSTMNMDINIGTMVISNIPFVKDTEGVSSFSVEEFECQAGAYHTTGSLVGTFDEAAGTIEFTVDYHPGSMPFTVNSVFKGSL